MPLGRGALRGAAVAIALMAMAAVAAASVRVLPWLFDGSVPWHVVAPFARGLGAVALEAAILVGWPIGWAMAAQQLVERGEALVLLTLGERPSRTIARLAPQAMVLAVVLAAVSAVGARDAREPGRVVTELLAQGKKACERASEPVAYAIPFAGATWLCGASASPGVAPVPRLAGYAPGQLHGALFTAADARVADDLRDIALTDAWLTFGASRVHAGEVTLRGLPPWARTSSLPTLRRALLLAIAAASAAALSAYFALGFSSRARRIHAILLGAAGPLAALGTLRALERTEAGIPAYFTVPLAGAGMTIVTAWVLSRLLRERWTARK